MRVFRASAHGAEATLCFFLRLRACLRRRTAYSHYTRAYGTPFLSSENLVVCPSTTDVASIPRLLFCRDFVYFATSSRYDTSRGPLADSNRVIASCYLKPVRSVGSSKNK
jgi:hypothetical protein